MTEEFPSKFSGPNESPGFLLWQLNNFWQQKQKKALSKLKLTHVQFVLMASLLWMETKKKKITQTQLASHAKTDLMMTSQVLRALEKKEFISRSPHPHDSRAMCLKLTQNGKKLTKEALHIVESVDVGFFSEASKDFSSACLELLQAHKNG